MLVLTQKEGQSIIIESPDGPITVTTCKVMNGRVSLGVDAPRNITVDREEVNMRKKREKFENGVGNGHIQSLLLGESSDTSLPHAGCGDQGNSQMGPEETGTETTSL